MVMLRRGVMPTNSGFTGTYNFDNLPSGYF